MRTQHINTMKKLYILLAALIMTCQLTRAQKIVKTFYDYKQTKLHEQYTTNNFGVKSGSYKEFSEYGGVLVQGTYKSDVKVGKWTTNNKDGTPYKVETFNDQGELDGPFTGWINGFIARQGTYKIGKKNGTWIFIESADRIMGQSYYSLTDEEKKINAYIKSSCIYKDDEPVYDGHTVMTYYPSGKTYRDATFSNGKVIGDNMVYFPNGKLIFYQKYDANGQVLLQKPCEYPGCPADSLVIWKK